MSGIFFLSLLAAAPRVEFDLAATDGMHHRSSEGKKSRATVLLFLATDCPISQRYSPLIQRLDMEYVPKGIRFLAVFSDPAITREAANQYLNEFELPMAGLLDQNATLAKQTGARVTPEAVILSASGEVLYRGRFDDRFVAWGKTRPAATQHDLSDALDAVLAGQPVPHPVTKALGCAISGQS